MNLAPGRYKMCRQCATPAELHDPQCPGFEAERGGEADLNAEGLAYIAERIKAGDTWVPSDLRRKL